MKTIFIGDTHGRPIWKDIVAKENADRVIFVGDYFDSFDIPGINQIHNFKEICEFKRNSDKEVILLTGNHDMHYMHIGETYSGFQPALQFDISHVLSENIDLLQMAYSFDDFLCTHAGVSYYWAVETFGHCNVDTLVDEINGLFKYKPRAFTFNGFDPYGDNVTQSPVWIRPNSLLISNKRRDKNAIKKRFIQVFGHTQIKQIDLNGMSKSMGGRYYMIDALPSKQYLIYDGELKVGTINE